MITINLLQLNLSAMRRFMKKNNAIKAIGKNLQSKYVLNTTTATNT